MSSVDLKDIATNIDSCIKRLNDFSEKFDTANEALSLEARAADNKQDINNLIADDSVFISKVIDCIGDLEKWRKSTVDIMTPSDMNSAVTLTDERASILQLQGQMQQLMLNQQDINTNNGQYIIKNKGHRIITPL